MIVQVLAGQVGEDASMWLEVLVVEGVAEVELIHYKSATEIVRIPIGKRGIEGVWSDTPEGEANIKQASWNVVVAFSGAMAKAVADAR